jgi:transposase
MAHEIRSILPQDDASANGKLEVNETYTGRKRPGKRGRGAEGKTSIFGIMQRQVKISATVTDDLKSSTIYPLIKKHVLS